MEHDRKCERSKFYAYLDKKLEFRPDERVHFFGVDCPGGIVCRCYERAFLPTLEVTDQDLIARSIEYVLLRRKQENERRFGVKNLAGRMPQVGDRFTVRRDGKLERIGEVIQVDFRNRRRVIE